jgi:hypothetical protein
LEEVGGGDTEEENSRSDELVSRTVKQAAEAAAKVGGACAIQIRESIMAKLEGVMEQREANFGPNTGIPVELLSPPASREPSPGRLRAKSPGRWRLLRTVHDLAERAAGGAYGTCVSLTVLFSWLTHVFVQSLHRMIRAQAVSFNISISTILGQSACVGRLEKV